MSSFDSYDVLAAACQWGRLRDGRVQRRDGCSIMNVMST
jgi:hypothetical protein